MKTKTKGNIIMAVTVFIMVAVMVLAIMLGVRLLQMLPIPS